MAAALKPIARAARCYRASNSRRPSYARRGVCRAPLQPVAALSTTPLGLPTALVTTLVSETLLHSTQLGPHASWWVANIAGDIVTPLVLGGLLIAAVHSIAQAGRSWCDANPGRPIASEIIGRLPAALEGPTVATVKLLVTLRCVLKSLSSCSKWEACVYVCIQCPVCSVRALFVLCCAGAVLCCRLVRNLTWLLDSYVHTFQANFSTTVGAELSACDSRGHPTPRLVLVCVPV